MASPCVALLSSPLAAAVAERRERRSLTASLALNALLAAALLVGCAVFQLSGAPAAGSTNKYHHAGKMEPGGREMGVACVVQLLCNVFPSNLGGTISR